MLYREGKFCYTEIKIPERLEIREMRREIMKKSIGTLMAFTLALLMVLAVKAPEAVWCTDYKKGDTFYYAELQVGDTLAPGAGTTDAMSIVYNGETYVLDSGSTCKLSDVISGYETSTVLKLETVKKVKYCYLGSPATDLSSFTLAEIPDQTYTGSALEPAITLTNGDTTLVQGTDFTAEYSNNIDVGTATVTITGAGSYSGSLTASFRILEDASAAATVNTASLTLGGDIGVNIYMTLPSSLADDAGAYVLVHQEKASNPIADRKILVSEAAEGNSSWKFTCHVAAKEMQDTLTFTLYDGEGNQVSLWSSAGNEYTDDAFSYSVMRYIDTVRNGSASAFGLSDEKYTALKNLVIAMSDYGSYAQTYFKYNTNTMAMVYNSMTGVTESSLRKYKYSESGSATGITFSGASLILETETSIRLQFLLDDADGDVSFDVSCDDYTGWSYEIGKSSSDGRVRYVVIHGIPAQYLGSAFTVTATNAESETLTVSYSPMSYAYAVVYQSLAENLMDLTRSLYYYYDYSKLYFAAQ